MTDAAATVQPATLSPTELRRLLADASSGQLALIDVREATEFARGHLEGAINLPFSEFTARAEEVEALPASRQVFLCHSGVRSTLAARHAAREWGLAGAQVLRGGLRAWEGRDDSTTLDLALAEEATSVKQYFLQLMELEVGSEQLYRQLATSLDDPAARSVLSALVDSERAHEKAVHELLVKTASEPVEPLEDMLQHTSGRVLASGESLDSLLARLNELGDQGTVAILELALDIEFTAHHLYRSVAALTDDAPTRSTCLRVAEEELHHANRVLRGMATLSAA